MANTSDNPSDTVPVIDGIADNAIDIRLALKLRTENNLTYRDIAKHLNCSKSGVYDALRPFLNIIENPLHTDAYVQNKSRLLSAVEMQLLTDLTDKEKRKNASLNNVAYAFKEISTQNQLEQGKATANINIHSVNQSVTESQDKIERLENEMSGN